MIWILFIQLKNNNVLKINFLIKTLKLKMSLQMDNSTILKSAKRDFSFSNSI